MCVRITQELIKMEVINPTVGHSDSVSGFWNLLFTPTLVYCNTDGLETTLQKHWLIMDAVTGTSVISAPASCLRSRSVVTATSCREISTIFTCISQTFHRLNPKCYCPSKPSDRLIFFISLKLIIIHVIAQARNRRLHLGWVGTSSAHVAGTSMPFQVAVFPARSCHVCLVILPWLSKWDWVLLGQTNSNNSLIYWGWLCVRHSPKYFACLNSIFREALEFPVVFGGLVSPEARSLPHISICH